MTRRPTKPAPAEQERRVLRRNKVRSHPDSAAVGPCFLRCVLDSPLPLRLPASSRVPQPRCRSSSTPRPVTLRSCSRTPSSASESLARQRCSCRNELASEVRPHDEAVRLGCSHLRPAAPAVRLILSGSTACMQPLVRCCPCTA
ncbi:hypothetical protein BV20DRAFT_963747 [Pilatotrama ljubarskyi]|nr:hypothetical protein BV20DRAFT_963747 [Pilatotrama ljubarskyi]